MKIAVGIPVFNDSMFVKQSVQNCLDVGYDRVVYLDDGSTDNTYELLQEYTDAYSHITVLKNSANTVYSASGNRWEICALECQKCNPDWIMSRAADECLSANAFKSGDNLLRKNLDWLDKQGFNYINFNYIDLWRSLWWYRVDGFWGHRKSVSCWKNKVGWSFTAPYGKIHVGAHRPTKLHTKINEHNINPQDNKELVVLHYGMSSHDLIVRKLKYQLDTAYKIKENAVNVPTQVPSIKHWEHFNGYKIGHEFFIQLVKVDPKWFINEIPDVAAPDIISLSSVIKEYDPVVAREYDSVLERVFRKKYLTNKRSKNARRSNK